MVERETLAAPTYISADSAYLFRTRYAYLYSPCACQLGLRVFVVHDCPAAAYGKCQRGLVSDSLL